LLLGIPSSLRRQEFEEGSNSVFRLWLFEVCLFLGFIGRLPLVDMSEMQQLFLDFG
jgi:hypothetical protein